MENPDRRRALAELTKIRREIDDAEAETTAMRNRDRVVMILSARSVGCSIPEICDALDISKPRLYQLLDAYDAEATT